jgi:hypothetical protein
MGTDMDTRPEDSSLWQAAGLGSSKPSPFAVVIAAVTPKTTTPASQQAREEQRQQLLDRLKKDATRAASMKSFLGVKLFLTLADFKLSTLIEHGCKLSTLLSTLLLIGSMGTPTLTFMDWIVLFQLPVKQAAVWLRQLLYDFDLHRLHAGVFPVGDLGKLGFTWDSLSASHLVPPVSALLCSSVVPTAREWLDLGFRLDAPSVQPYLTRDLFLHLAFFGAWTCADAMFFGLTPEQLRDFALTNDETDQLNNGRPDKGDWVATPPRTAATIADEEAVVVAVT